MDGGNTGTSLHGEPGGPGGAHTSGREQGCRGAQNAIPATPSLPPHHCSWVGEERAPLMPSLGVVKEKANPPNTPPVKDD